MLRHARSNSNAQNPNFTELVRKPGEGNVEWCRRAAKLMKTAGPDAWTYVALLGGADTLSFRLRVAQSHLRSDMLPSYWSEAILIQLASDSLEEAQAIYVPLAQPEGPWYAPQDNGVVARSLAVFDAPSQYPNIAVIALPVPQERVMRRLESFKRSRPTLDALEHILRWLAFSWGVARTGNPLHENYGIPSACMLEIILAAEDFDLTPGLESRTSCPEAIWSSAKYWHEYFAKTGGADKVPCGCYLIEHSYPILESEQSPVPSEQLEAIKTTKASKESDGKGKKTVVKKNHRK